LLTRENAKSFPAAVIEHFSHQRKPDPPAFAAPGSGCGVECVDDVGRDTAAGGNVMAVATGPVTDCGALLAIDGTTPPTGARASAATAADPARSFHPLLQVVAEFRRILGRKINLIGYAVEAEFDGFIGSTFTVEIVDKGDGHFLRHWLSLMLSS
jgi:hypothetical protein